jgi:hypothetical protein
MQADNMLKVVISQCLLSLSCSINLLDIITTRGYFAESS